MAEHEKHEKSEKKVAVKKTNLVIISVAIVALVIGFAAGMVFNPGLGGSVEKTAAGQRVVDYINNNLVQPGTSVSLVSVEDSNGLYKVTTSYQGTNIPVYVDKSGKIMFVSTPMMLNETIEQTPAETQPTETPKTDKPAVELFVMAFCPYGVQAEQIMKPVVDLLGSKADIKVRFIASISGNTSDSVDSLHGPTEAMEDLRQVCINKYYPSKYWSYLDKIDANCYSVARDAAALDTCWKAAATNLSMDVAKIDTCSKNSEGLDLLKADEAITSGYGVTGSPTLIINGVTYSGSRTSEAFKAAICSAFNTPPAECGTTVNSTAAAAQGGCGT